MTSAVDQPLGPVLVVLSDRRSGPARRAEGFLAQVLQRRGNHDTFRLHRVDVGDRPELAERFAVNGPRRCSSSRTSGCPSGSPRPTAVVRSSRSLHLG